MTGPLKWHGGKHFLAAKIIGLMPPHVHYVEPYAGGLAVLFARDPGDKRLWLPPHEGVSEVVNDMNLLLTIFWRVLADESLFKEFQRAIQGVPFSEVEWREAANPSVPPGGLSVPSVLTAVTFFVYCRQSLAGRMKSFAPLSRTRLRRGMSEQASAWLGAVEGLAAIHERLKKVIILNRPALEVFRSQDGPGTFFYADPPYLHETRASTDDYAHEMTPEEHHALLCTLTKLKGKFLLSGYRSILYDHHANEYGWKRTDFDVPNNAAGGAGKRRMTECVWSNY